MQQTGSVTLHNSSATRAPLILLAVLCPLAATQKHWGFSQVCPLPGDALFLTTILWAEGLHYSLIIMGSLSSPDVQEELLRHNISAVQRARRVRNAGVSIAYNAGVMRCRRFEPWC